MQLVAPTVVRGGACHVRWVSPQQMSGVGRRMRQVLRGGGAEKIHFQGLAEQAGLQLRSQRLARLQAAACQHHGTLQARIHLAGLAS